MKTLKEQCNEIKVEVTRLQTELKAKQIQLFDEVKKRLFDENPKLESFGFNGYIPYFNDGDECVFRSNHSYPDVNGVNYDEFHYGSRFKGPVSKEEMDVLGKAVNDVLGNFDDSFYQDVFGDHFRVVFTRTNTEVEEYTDHD